MDTTNNQALELSAVLKVLGSKRRIKLAADALSVEPQVLYDFLVANDVDLSDLNLTVTDRARYGFQHWEDSGTSLVAAAAEIGTTRTVLGSTLNRLGLYLSGKRTRTGPEDIERAVTDVTQYIMTKGGSIPDALRSLGLSISEATVRNRLREKDIDLAPYFYAYRRYNDWLVLPGMPQYKYENDKLLRCRCLRCGKEFDVLYNNLASGKSKCCINCASNCNRAVRVLETGENYSSMRSAASATLVSYTALRTGLAENDECSVDGFTFQLAA